MDVWAFEKQAERRGYDLIAGVDEAGRGPLAGPVVAAAVMLPPDFKGLDITDSKQLSPARRRKALEVIYQHAISVGIGLIDALEIDRCNILQASLRAMAMAVSNLAPPPHCLLIDGTFTIPSPLPQQAIPKGDRLSISVSAASIVAKETRDALMLRYHQEYPQYGFDRHKGYPTRRHREVLARDGGSPIHRYSFKGVPHAGGTANLWPNQ